MFYPWSVTLLRPRALRALRAVTLLVTACAVLAGVVLGGTRYFFCAPMQAAMAAPCCEHRLATGDTPAARELVLCCEARAHDAVPPATSEGDVVALPPGARIERVLPLASDSTRAHAVVRPILDVRRTGPPPPRWTSTVFLI